MKKFSTLLFTLVLTLVALAQVPNSSFETWVGSPEEPQSWATPNKSLALFTTNFPVNKTTDASSGSLAALLETKSYTITIPPNPPFTATIPGIITTGTLNIDLSNNQPIFAGGVPYGFRPEKFNFKYKYTPSGVDTFIAFAVLTKYNTVAQKRDTVGIATTTGTINSSSYLTGSLNINYMSTVTPDTMMMVFSSSKFFAPQVGSKLYVDNIEEQFFTGIKQPLSIETKVQLFPNPAVNNLNVIISNYLGKMTFNVYDILGKQVNSYTFETDENIIDVSGYKNGMYFYELKDSNGRTTKAGKFNIAH